MTSDAPRTAPYGTWRSPVTAAETVRGEPLLEWIGFVGDDVWWVESRPDTGRSALVRRGADGAPVDVLSPEWSVRSRVIEYGGRPWLSLGAHASQGIVFANWADQRVYRYAPGADPRPLTPGPGKPGEWRYCDFARSGDYVWCLRETVGSGSDVRRDLVAIPLDGSAADDPAAVRTLAASHHFMTGPKVSPDGLRVAWIGWNHPAMPWDGTDLVVAEVLPDSGLGAPTVVAGGADVSVSQVEWSDRPGILHALCDIGGWWNLHEIAPSASPRNICERPEEFGEALWRIGGRWFLPLSDGRFAATHGTDRRPPGTPARAAPHRRRDRRAGRVTAGRHRRPQPRPGDRRDAGR